MNSPHQGAAFADLVIAWQAAHGRHDLPWTLDRSAYRVWLSEIMLQQTQVTTVIPYFERFVARFPGVRALAAADIDEVLHLWSGLGYYSRARNLHRTAQIVVDKHAGRFPNDVPGLSELPGIGRSTAGAIVALAGDRRAAILDGNVKRVLARYHAVDGWPGQSAVLKTLWRLAEAHLPQANFCAYTQALMDLGATLCTRRAPACERCPVHHNCAARKNGDPEGYPARRPQRTLPTRDTCFLIVEDNAGAVLLERRPASGIWGGLWCFPQVDNENGLDVAAAALGLVDYDIVERLADVTHTFTHFRLNIQPLRLRATNCDAQIRESDDLCWYRSAAANRLGLPAPVARLLKKLSVGAA